MPHRSPQLCGKKHSEQQKNPECSHSGGFEPTISDLAAGITAARPRHDPYSIVRFFTYSYCCSERSSRYCCRYPRSILFPLRFSLSSIFPFLCSLVHFPFLCFSLCLFLVFVLFSFLLVFPVLGFPFLLSFSRCLSLLFPFLFFFFSLFVCVYYPPPPATSPPHPTRLPYIPTPRGWTQADMMDVD